MKKTLVRILATISLTAGITMSAEFSADAQSLLRRTLFPKKDSVMQKKKKQLADENKQMSSQIDSLKEIIRDYENNYRRNDSIAQEMFDIFEENEDKMGASLSPKDYTPDVTDSLLKVWYRHRQTKRTKEMEQYDMDSVHFTSNVPDRVYIERLAKMNSYITLPYNETVRNFIILYSEKMPSKMASMLSSSAYYLPIFEEAFNKYKMPEELKYMAVIESALNPTAVSRAGAKGMWQFMYSTAKGYGLTINSFVDERLDPYKAADAAARYLKDAYQIFGDWNLAISSYNCGAGNVNKAIRRSGSKDFWALYDFLPRETRGYVPAFVGAMYAFKYFKEHGIVPDKPYLPEHVDTFHIRRNLHFRQISEVIGIPVDMLRGLNPQYINDIIPGNEAMYVLRLPYQFTTQFIENEDSVYAHRTKELLSEATLLESHASASGGHETRRTVYRVKSGDYLGRIAARNNVSVNDLKKWNHLRSSKLKVGQKLVIIKKVRVAQPASSASTVKSASDNSSDGNIEKADSSSSKPQSTSGAGQTGSENVADGAGSSGKSAGQSSEMDYSIYVVRKGDTLFEIAKRYPGISAKDIMNYNNIGSNIRPGMKLRIPKK